MYYTHEYMFAPVRTCVGVHMHEHLCVCVCVSLQESQETNTLPSRSRRNVGFLCSSAPSLPLLQSQKSNGRLERKRDSLQGQLAAETARTRCAPWLRGWPLQAPSPGSTAAASLLSFMDETGWTTHSRDGAPGLGEEQEHLSHVVWMLTTTLASPIGLVVRKEN